MLLSPSGSISISNCICIYLPFLLHCMKSFPTPWSGIWHWHWHWHGTCHMSVESSVPRLGTVLYNIRGASIPVGTVHGYCTPGRDKSTRQQRQKQKQVKLHRQDWQLWRSDLQDQYISNHSNPDKANRQGARQRKPGNQRRRKKNDLQTGARPLNSPAPYQLSPTILTGPMTG